MGKKNKTQKAYLPARHNPLTNQNKPAIITHAESFSGPIPPPDLLAKYAEIIPDGATRILAMAEKQSKHRQCIEKWAVIGGTVLSYFGVLCALLIAYGTLHFGSQLILENHVISGSIFSGIGLVSLVTAFIYGTRSRKEERLQRDQQNKELLRR